MDNMAWVIGLIIAVLGSGFVYSKVKNHKIGKLEEQNRELAYGKAISDAERVKAEQKAEAAEAGSELQRKAYEAVSAADRKADTESDTPLSEEDKRLAKDIMDNHRC